MAHAFSLKTLEVVEVREFIRVKLQQEKGKFPSLLPVFVQDCQVRRSHKVKT